MGEIEVVIRIPEEWIEQFKAFKHPSTLETVILQGTVLPKGHGDLISRVEVLEKLHEYFDPLADGEDICPADIYHEINALSGVIAADKGEEHGA